MSRTSKTSIVSAAYSDEPPEASWGADPLEYIGGFRSLEYDSQTKYPSSLGTNGEVGWSIHEAHGTASEQNVAKVAFAIGFPNVDWPFLQSIYGWAALQYQAWARGTLVVEGNALQSVIFFTDNVLEFRVDNEPFFGGDIYAYRRAPLVLQLKPGNHRIDLRLSRDVRIMGGAGEPKISIQFEAQISAVRLAVMTEKLLVPEMVQGQLASSLASIPVRNEGNEWIEIVDVMSMDVCICATHLLKIR